MKTINLPCTVGDMIYQPFGVMIIPYYIKEIVINDDGIFIKAMNIRSEDTYIDTFNINQIGKSIFLSNTEAVQKQMKDTQLDLILEQQGGIL